jgi:hypothetical protein
MSVVRIDVLCMCDGCADRFGVELEIGTDLKDCAYSDIEEWARDTIRGGNATCYKWGVRGRHTVDRMPLTYQATIQAGLMLCGICSWTCDNLPIEGNLTRAQVYKALGLPEHTT